MDKSEFRAHVDLLYGKLSSVEMELAQLRLQMHKFAIQQQALSTQAVEQPDISEPVEVISRKEHTKVPSLKDAVAIVIGSGEMSAGTILDELVRRNWMPDSKNPRQYISFILSNYSKGPEQIFEKSGKRGLYKVVIKGEFKGPKPTETKTDTQLMHEWGIDPDSIDADDDPFKHL